MMSVCHYARHQGCFAPPASFSSLLNHVWWRPKGAWKLVYRYVLFNQTPMYQNARYIFRGNTTDRYFRSPCTGNAVSPIRHTPDISGAKSDISYARKVCRRYHTCRFELTTSGTWVAHRSTEGMAAIYIFIWMTNLIIFHLYWANCFFFFPLLYSCFIICTFLLFSILLFLFVALYYFLLFLIIFDLLFVFFLIF